MQNRIKLAEAIGWKDILLKYVAMDNQSYPFGCHPECNDPKFREQIPDPFTDANDCEALIRHLQNDAWIIVVTYGHGAYNPYDAVSIESHPERLDFNDKWTGDDWKQGVCELALKVIDD